MSNPHDKARESQDLSLFEEIAHKYIEKDRVKSSSLPRKYQLMFAVKPVLDKIGRKPVLVDVACGPGAPAEYLKDYYESYIGIDYAQEMVEAARILNQSNEKAKFIASNIKNIPDLTEKADLIIAIGAFHHMTDLKAVMDSLKKISKPGGYLAALEPQRNNPLIQFMRFMRGILDKSYSAEQHYFSRSELYKLFESNGMTDIELEYQGYFSPPFAQMILNPQSIFVPLSKLAIIMDKLFDRVLPDFLKFISWNIAIRCRFPK